MNLLRSPSPKIGFFILIVWAVGLADSPNLFSGTKLAEFDFSSPLYATGNLVGQDNWGRVGTNTLGPLQVSNGVAILKNSTASTNEQVYHPLNLFSLSNTGGKTFIRLDVKVKNAYRSSGGNGDYWFGLASSTNLSGTSYDRVYVKKTSDGTGFTFGLNAGIAVQYNDERIYSLNTAYTLLLTHEVIDGTKNDKVTLSLKPASGLTEDFVPLLTQSFSGAGTYTKADGTTSTLPNAGTAANDPASLQSLGFWQRSAGTSIAGVSAFNQIEISNVSLGTTLSAVDLPASSQPATYSAPANFPFLQQPTGEKVISLQDTSGSISTLQDMIDGARTANPDLFLIVYCKAGATYPVTSAPLVLGSKVCLLGNGATFQANANSTASSLIRLSPNASFVSVLQTTLLGGSANLYGIEGSGVSRIALDQVTVRQTGKSGIYLQGTGATNFDNQITVTRCQASQVTTGGYAGIHLSQATQAVCLDNQASNNPIGIYLESSSACALFNNQAHANSSSGISLNNSTVCKIAKNRCSNNLVGLTTTGSSSSNQYNVFVANEILGTNTGFSLGAAANILYRNTLSSALSNPVTTTGSGLHRILTIDSPLSVATNQEYFYPPTAFNPHTNSIMNGKARTDITTAATSLSAIQAEYDAARSNNPSNFLVLHLTAPQITGDATINLTSFTSVILDGTINLHPGITAFASSNQTHLCLSGGMILGGNTTGRSALSFANGSRILVENMTLSDFGDKTNRVGNSDVIAFAGCGNPCMVTGCTINGGAARGIWTKGNSFSSTAGFIVMDNWISNMNMDGIDFDVTTSSSLAFDNTCTKNIRYGIFTEEGANLNHLIRNLCSSNEIGLNLYSLGTNNTIRNTLIANTCQANQRGIRFGAASPWETSQNFAFNNQISGSTSSGIDAQNIGSANYCSQNILAGNTANLGSTLSAVFFNPPIPGNSLPLTYADWTSRFIWYGNDATLTADPNGNGSSNLLDYALMQNPLSSSLPTLPVSAYDTTTVGGPWVTLTYRHNKNATDLTYETWSSTDLQNWTLQSVDGLNVLTETLNPDVDGDGATDLWRTRIKVAPNETKRFLRLRIQKN